MGRFGFLNGSSWLRPIIVAMMLMDEVLEKIGVVTQAFPKDKEGPNDMRKLRC